MHGKVGKEGWDDVVMSTFDAMRFIPWIAMCHEDIGHCGMCPDCLKPKAEIKEPLAA
jgi:hypothetical protein